METNLSQLQNSLLAWVNTFKLSAKIESFQALKDGVVIVDIMSQM
jgi:hypothetical protein